ncbi:JmjC domain-containing protein [Pseudomonas sp. NPDC089530]|uniref:JmjC domain-containing protein n=1 Tax=Pseudomonas sp. NPDC089530 TaxID=3390651 RepID=UPI003CFE6209
MNILQQMFGDQTEVFLRAHWPKHSYVADGEMSRFTELAKLEEFNDIRKLFHALQGPVDLLFPGGKRITVAKSADAIAPYNDGAAMVYIKDLEALPAVSSACDELAEVLGIPRHYVSCEAFAANYGVEVAVHFDHETNFMIQIKGEKTWKFAENISLPDPIYPFFPNNPNRFYKEGTHPYTGEKLPVAMPQDHQERLVKPGTTTFMPRGYWHSTVAHEESFSIGFVINPPTIADIITYALLERLHGIEDLRAHPLDTLSNSSLERTLSDIRKGLDEAGKLSRSLTPEELLQRYKQSRKGNIRTLTSL